MRTPRLLVGLVLVSLSLPGFAQDPAGAEGAAPDRAARARAAFAAFEAAEQEAAAIRSEATARMRKAEKDDAAARKAWLGELQRATRLVDEARAKLRVEFDRCDWGTWELPRDARLLEEGLNASARHAIEGDPEHAVRAWEHLLDVLPRCGSADMVRRTWLPIAWPSTGRFDAAVHRIDVLIEQVEPKWRHEMRIAAADTVALSGDLEGARKRLQAALAALPPLEGLERYDPARRAKGYLDLRLALLGRPAPEIASETWLGAEARPLSALRGQVVVLDFWSTWCQPCRTVMPGLDDLAHEYAPKGLQLLGVTRYYDYGFLPDGPDDMHRGRSVRPIAEADFVAHLRAFRTNTKLRYPFVVGTGEDFANYRIAGIPTIFVIDRRGIVCYVAIGGAREALVRLAIQSALDGE